MKRKLLLLIIVVVLLVLFFPVSKGTLNDGGTREYQAITYKIVVWNKLLAEPNIDGSAGNVTTYHKTSVYWFADAHKSIDELWKTEIKP